jgi:hypothetical protein
MLLRRGTRGSIADIVALGFDAAIDVRDAETEIDVRSAVFFGNTVQPVVEPEAKGTTQDDDDGFDEEAWMREPSRAISGSDPGIPGCFDADRPAFAPARPLTRGAVAPPDDGFFDPGAGYLGAFRDSDDRWALGPWTAWSAR